MKRNLFALALVLFFGNVLLASAQVSPGQPPPTGSTRLVVSEYGTLLKVLNADGSSRFGPLTLDGFRVSYSFGGQLKEVHARGATDVQGLRAGQVTVEGNSTIMIVTTDDDALEITNRFTLDEQTNKLIIRRSLRNLSSETLKLLVTKQYLDPKLIGAMCSNGPKSLKKAASLRVTALGCEGDYCALVDRPPHDPPCLTVVCLNNSLRYQAFLPTPEATQRIGDCMGITLEWRRTKIFAPSSREVSGNEVKVMHFVLGVKLQER